MREYLVELRKKHDLSQQDVADYVGISRQYYNAIENGIRQKKMDVTLITKFADLFKTSLQKICDAESEWQNTNQ